jgi:hypothetical protein
MASEPNPLWLGKATGAANLVLSSAVAGATDWAFGVKQHLSCGIISFAVLFASV